MKVVDDPPREGRPPRLAVSILVVVDEGRRPSDDILSADPARGFQSLLLWMKVVDEYVRAGPVHASEVSILVVVDEGRRRADHMLCTRYNCVSILVVVDEGRRRSRSGEG